MLRSQSISDINEKKISSTSKLFNAFKRLSNGTTSTDVQEKRKSRPLSTSISALNLKISSPILNQQSDTTSATTPSVTNYENKENINHHHRQQQQQQQNIKLKTRSSTPNLNRRSSVIFSNSDSRAAAHSAATETATARMLRTNNRYSFIAGNNFQVHNNKATVDDNSHYARHSSTATTTASSTAHISPVTISSHSDSIFDQSSINCVDDDSEDGASSEISSIHTAETSNEPSNYTYAKVSNTNTKSKSKSSSSIPESPSSSIISTSVPKKLHRTTNLYNLNEFINKLSIDSSSLPITQPLSQMISMNNRQSIEFENKQIKQLNQQLNQVADYHCEVKLVENILFLTTTTATGEGSTEKSQSGFGFGFDLDEDDYLNMLKTEEYNLESTLDNCFESDGDQLYLMY